MAMVTHAKRSMIPTDQHALCGTAEHRIDIWMTPSATSQGEKFVSVGIDQTDRFRNVEIAGAPAANYQTGLRGWFSAANLYG